MAIKVITGKPGSGKSYYAVSHLMKHFFQFDDEHYDFNPKSDDVLIITNMAGLKLRHLDFRQAAKEVNAESIYDLLRIPNIPNASEEECCRQSKIWQLKEKYKSKIVFIFDEIQRQFPVNYRDQEVIFFFDYHRHLGVDIYALSQSWKKVCPLITELCEYEYRAMPKSRQFLNELNYHVYSGFDKVGSFKLVPSKKVFALYKSSEEAELKGKEIRPTRKFAVVAVLLAVSVFGMTSYWLTGFGSRKATVKPVVEQGVGSARLAPAASPPPAPDKLKPVLPSSAPQKAQDHNAENKQESINEPHETKDVKTAKDYVLVTTGGMWKGEDLIAIQFNGTIYRPENFPYGYLPNKGKTIVQVVMPRNELSTALASFSTTDY